MKCDTDTIGAIAGAICESHYGKCTKIDNEIIRAYLTSDLFRDLESCEINLTKIGIKEFTVYHDTVEEKHIYESMEAANKEVYMMDEEYDQWEGYECAEQIIHR